MVENGLAQLGGPLCGICRRACRSICLGLLFGRILSHNTILFAPALLFPAENSPARANLKQVKSSLWIMRAAWLAVPFTSGELLASALDGYTPSFRTSCAIGLWVIWGTTAVAAMIARPVTLGFVRIWVPAGLAATIWAVIETQSSGSLAGDEVSSAEPALFLVVLAIAVATLAAAASLMPSVGATFINSPFANTASLEKRLPLRPPAAGAFVLAPLLWAVVVAGPVSGYLLLAAERWLIGAAALIAGLIVATLSCQSLLILGKRWVVFVPAGIVLHDPLTLGDEAILLPKSGVKSLRVVPASTRRLEAAAEKSKSSTPKKPASKQSQSQAGPTQSPEAQTRESLHSGTTDLCAGCLGAAIELRLHEPARIPRLHKAPELATAIRFAPASADAFIQEALTRDIIP